MHYEIEGSTGPKSVQIIYPQVIVDGVTRTPIEEIVYNTYGQAERFISTDGIVTKFEYGGGRVTKAIADYHPAQGLNIVTEYSYDAAGNLTDTRYQYDLWISLFNHIRCRYNSLDQLTNTLSPSPYVSETIFRYDQCKQLQEVKRQIGANYQKASYTYDILDNIETIASPITDALNRQTTNDYWPDESFKSVLDAENHSTNYEYNGRGLLKKSKDAKNAETLYDYDNNGNLWKITDALNQVTEYAHDLFDRLQQIKYADNTTEQFTYYDTGTIHTYKNRANETITYSYDALNRVTQKVYSGTPTRTINYKYDIAGRLTRVEDTTAGQATLVTTYTYDRIGLLVDTVNQQSRDVSYEYDRFGRRSKLIYPDGSFVTYEYDWLGRLSSMNTDEVVGYWPMVDDCWGWGGNTVAHDISGHGNNGTTTRVWYDIWTYGMVGAAFGFDGVQDRIEVPNSSSLNFGDNVDFTISAWVEVASTNSGGAIFHKRTGDTGYAVSVSGTQDLVVFIGGTSTQQRTIPGILTPGQYVLVTFVFDRDGQCTIYRNGQPFGTPFNISGLGNITNAANCYMGFAPPGSYFTGRIDDVRIYKKALSGSEIAGLYKVGANDPKTGLLCFWSEDYKTYAFTADDWTYSEEFWFDPVWQWDEYGILPWTPAVHAVGDQPSDPTDSKPVYCLWSASENRYYYAWDAAEKNALVTAGWQNNGIWWYKPVRKDFSYQLVRYDYDHLSRLESKRYRNGREISYEYDLASRLLEIDDLHSTYTDITYNYTYDKMDNRLTKSRDSATADQYTYDQIYQLDYVTPASGPVVDYVYDFLGNRDYVDIGSTRTDYTLKTNGLNQYNTVGGGASYTYDSKGNLAYDGTQTYIYDHENRLIEVKQGQGGSTIATYQYDYAGRRIRKTAGGNTIEYVYDGDQVIAEYSGSTLLRKYVYGPGIDNPVCMIDASGNKYYYHQDGLGSIVALSNNNGQIVEQYTYDEFGNTSGSSSIGNPYRFTGREWDSETVLYYYRARYYKPSIGRFLQTDPVGYVDSMNLYTYCGNNPLNWTDPSGLLTGVEEAATATAVPSAASWVYVTGGGTLVGAGTVVAAGTGVAVVSGGVGYLIGKYGVNPVLDRLADALYDRIVNPEMKHKKNPQREEWERQERARKAARRASREGTAGHTSGKDEETHTAADGHSSRIKGRQNRGDGDGGSRGFVPFIPDDDSEKHCPQKDS